MIQPEIFQNLPWVSAGFCDALESTKITHVLCMKQPHFSDVRWVDHFENDWIDADAIVTDTPNLTLAVRTADCGPILLADTQKHIVAAVHAGWKSAVQGLIENTVFMMQQHGSKTDDIVAAIGPHLQKESFVVSSEMQGLFPPIHQHFFTTQNDKIHFDFNAYLKMRLNHAGISQIDSVDIDTYPDERYNSYRRDCKNPNRQLSLIQILGGNHV